MPDFTWGRRRQFLIITTIIVAIAFMIGGYIYYKISTRVVSCTNGVHDTNERGVDCGGVCSRICADEIKDIVINYVRLFKIRDGQYSAIARVENPNQNAIAQEVPYTFSLKNAAGEVVATRSGKVFVASKKSIVVFEGTIETGSSTPESAYFQFDGQPNWQRSDYIEPQLIISNKVLTDVDTLPRMTATVENHNIVPVKNINLSALIYDDEGNVVQASKTFVDKIESDGTANVTFTWPLPISLKARVCQSPIDISLILDRSGSMRYLSDNPPQPLTDVKNAADYFTNQLSKSDLVSMVSFANTATNPIDAILSSNFTEIRKAIDSISILGPETQNTNIEDGIQKGSDELLGTHARTGAGKIMILLTDGVPDLPTKKGDDKYPETTAIAAAMNAKAKGITIFTIGLGKDINQTFLKKLASSADDFYQAPTADQLQNIYLGIGTKMCQRKPTTLEVVSSIPPAH